MKGLYVSLDHFISSEMIAGTYTGSNGIIKKICNQYKTFESYGFEMKMYCPYIQRNHRIHSIIRRLPFSGEISYGGEYVKNAKDYAFVFLRSPWFMNMDTPQFLKKMKQNNPQIRIIVEVPTYDPSWGKGEINHWHMWPLYWKNVNAIRHLKESVDRIMTFSRDETIYDIPTLCTSNAIDPKSIKPVDHINSIENRINLIACSSMAFWHGFDRIIEGMKNYYQGDHIYEIIFHLVGDGEETENYKKLIDRYKLNDYIILYGYKSGQELNDIYNLSDIAIDSLGRHRSKVYYNSSLKGKEYLAKGLPVVSGVTNELDDDKSFKYYLRVPADDSPVEMSKIIEFYNKIYNGNRTRIEIEQYISRYAEEHFSYNVALKPVYRYIINE